MNTEALPITISPSGDRLTISLADHSLIGARGIPGTDDALSQNDREVTVILPFITDCDLFANSTYSVTVGGRRPCGLRAFGNNNRTVSDKIIIRGAQPTFVGDVSVDLIEDVVAGCAETLITIDFTNDIGTTGDQDSVFLTLPAGTRYAGGAITCNTVPAADCPILARVVEGINQQLIFRIPEGVEAPQNFSLELPIDVETTGGCAEINEVEVRVVTTRNDIICVGSNMNCPAFRIVVTEAVDTAAFVKNELALSDFAACTQAGNYFVQGSVSGFTQAGCCR